MGINSREMKTYVPRKASLSMVIAAAFVKAEVSHVT